MGSIIFIKVRHPPSKNPQDFGAIWLLLKQHVSSLGSGINLYHFLLSKRNYLKNIFLRRTASRQSAGMVPAPSVTKGAVMQVYGADTWGWRG